MQIKSREEERKREEEHKREEERKREESKKVEVKQIRNQEDTKKIESLQAKCQQVDEENRKLLEKLKQAQTKLDELALVTSPSKSTKPEKSEPEPAKPAAKFGQISYVPAPNSVPFRNFKIPAKTTPVVSPASTSPSSPVPPSSPPPSRPGSASIRVEKPQKESKGGSGFGPRHLRSGEYENSPKDSGTFRHYSYFLILFLFLFLSFVLSFYFLLLDCVFLKYLLTCPQNRLLRRENSKWKSQNFRKTTRSYQETTRN